ncbi:MAG: iron-containing alcohol dehydrogenase [Gammaproteobacteria bacterium]|nr:iron-containing alcohol dehydrogenase [Gammaproteobacteria bacterium]
MSLEAVNWNYPTAIRYGCGRVREIAEVCRQLGIFSPLIVTDPGLAKLPMTNNIRQICHSEGLSTELLSDIRANPTGSNVDAGIRICKKQSHDGVIALGGGSALDAAKAIATMAYQNCDLWALEDIGDNWRKADRQLILPTIAIPTTAGTGSEVGRASVIVKEDEPRKVILFHPNMCPVCVILDPELTVSLPATLTAATGMDALSHNLEAYCSPVFHPMASSIATEGIQIIFDNLEQAVRDGSDLHARGQMLVASTMGATAFQRGLGAMHALAHPLGALYDAHHGTLNAVLMPYVLQANRQAIEPVIAKLSRYLGLDEGFKPFLEWILDLRLKIGIPNTLTELGIDESRMDEIGEMAVADPSAVTNPIQFDARQYCKIGCSAVVGDLST